MPSPPFARPSTLRSLARMRPATFALCTRLLLATTRFALGFCLATWMACVLGLMCGACIGGWPLVAGWVAGWVAAGCGPGPWRERGLGLLLVTFAALASCGLALSFPDCSWDGALYHQPAMFALADGWNPLDGSASPLPSYVPAAVADCVRSYPKAMWMIGAALYRATGDVVAANALHWLLLLAPLGPALFVARTRGRHGMVHSLLIAALVAANPVVVYQLATSYVDGLVASLTTVVVLALMANGCRHKGRWLLLAASAAALLVGTKFTGLVYAVSIAGIFSIAAWHRARSGCVAGYLALGILVGVVGAGDAYVRNTFVHGNPFHPAWRAAAPSVLANQAAPEFLALGRCEQVVRSLASVPCDSGVELQTMPQLRLPLTAWHWPARHDPRFCGFGPLFFEAVLLAFWATFLRGTNWVATIAVVGSALATDAAWWARLAPQWWLLPLLPLFGRSIRPHRHDAMLVWGVIVVLVLDVVLVASSSWRAANRVAREWQRTATAEMKTPTIDQYLARPEHEYCMRRRLHERWR